MGYIAYADRTDEANQLISYLFDPNEKYFCYRSKSGYGITAFFHRICYLLKSTNVLCLFAELSDNSRSPLHEVLKKIAIKEGVLYQTIQMYADEYYGEYSQTLIESMIHDLPALGESLASLIAKPKAAPIYTGYYSDGMKGLFFSLLKTELSNKQIIFFVDNIQFIDNESIYDILALLEYRNVKVVMSFTGESDLAQKLLLEMEIRISLRYLDFNEPSVKCVQELWQSKSKDLTISHARELLCQSQGNIRSLVFAANNGYLPDRKIRSLLANEILAIIYTAQLGLNLTDIYAMISDSPSSCMEEEKTIKDTIQILIHKGYLSAVLQIDGQQTIYARIRDENQRVWYSLIENPADRLVYEDIVYHRLCQHKTHTKEELVRLFDLASAVYPQDKQQWGILLLTESLKQGTKISYNWIQEVKYSADPNNQFLCAISLFREWKYSEAFSVLQPLWIAFSNNRDIKILYALTLNRCRKHSDADKLLWELIKSSSSIDEKTLLLSVVISNYVHSGKEDYAKKLLNDYRDEASASKLFGYFLRNAATLFEAGEAKEYWNKALVIFREARDEYGELTTIINMTRLQCHGSVCQEDVKGIEQAYRRLMSFGMSQLHIASNNLGVAYLRYGDFASAKKQLRIAKVISKSIMPKTYITINLCCVLLEENQPLAALRDLLKLKNEVDASNIPRLKRRYYVALSGVYCICGEYEKALDALSHAETVKTTAFSETKRRIRRSSVKKQQPDKAMWCKYVPPAFLEYWISTPLSIMSDDALSRHAFFQN